MFPVIQSGAPNLAFVEGESEWLYQVELCASGQARPAGISDIPVNLRVNEYDMSGGDSYIADQHQGSIAGVLFPGLDSATMAADK